MYSRVQRFPALGFEFDKNVKGTIFIFSVTIGFFYHYFFCKSGYYNVTFHPEEASLTFWSTERLEDAPLAS